MPVYDETPGWAKALGGLIGGAGNFIAGREQAKQQKAAAEAEAEKQRRAAALAQANLDLKGREVGVQESNALTNAKREAASELHQQAADALQQAKFEYGQTKDAKAFAQKQQQINQAYQLGRQKIEAGKTEAEIRAGAQESVAQIHAAATVQAASIRAASGAANRAQRASSKPDPANLSAQGKQFYSMLLANPPDTNMAQRTLNDANIPAQDKAILHALIAQQAKSGLTQKPPTTTKPKAVKKTALDQVKEARAAGVTDDDLLLNQLIGSGYTKAAAQAAIDAVPAK